MARPKAKVRRPVRAKSPQKKRPAKFREDYKQLYDFAPVIWMVLDSVGLIKDISSAGSTLFGASTKFVLGTPLRMWVDTESRATLLTHFRRCRSTEEAVETEVRLPSPTGNGPEDR